jgi:hypothetical protein
MEVEGWTDNVYQQNFMDLLEQQPYMMGTLMESDEGLDDSTHSWMLKSVLLLKWSFQKMGWRLTMLSNEKWQGVIEEKMEVYESHQEEHGLDISALIKLSSSPNNATTEEAKGNVLFLLDCAIDAMEMAVLQDKTESNA